MVFYAMGYSKTNRPVNKQYQRGGLKNEEQTLLDADSGNHAHDERQYLGFSQEWGPRRYGFYKGR